MFQGTVVSSSKFGERIKRGRGGKVRVLKLSEIVEGVVVVAQTKPVVSFAFYETRTGTYLLSLARQGSSNPLENPLRLINAFLRIGSFKDYMDPLIGFCNEYGAFTHEEGLVNLGDCAKVGKDVYEMKLKYAKGSLVQSAIFVLDVHTVSSLVRESTTDNWVTLKEHEHPPLYCEAIESSNDARFLALHKVEEYQKGLEQDFKRSRKQEVYELYRSPDKYVVLLGERVTDIRLFAVDAVVAFAEFWNEMKTDGIATLLNGVENYFSFAVKPPNFVTVELINLEGCLLLAMLSAIAKMNKLQIKQCKECKAWFISQNKRQLFCSHNCRSRHAMREFYYRKVKAKKDHSEGP